ncbi:hypothetical protein DFJ73DRAFT_817622 [Zopfochytrium polystomum]|nr:hypothetical protein DFJ73DRAFT_817622 [Zopfochytrium polystomum]
MSSSHAGASSSSASGLALASTATDLFNQHRRWIAIGAAALILAIVIATPVGRPSKKAAPKSKKQKSNPNSPAASPTPAPSTAKKRTLKSQTGPRKTVTIMSPDTTRSSPASVSSPAGSPAFTASRRRFQSLRKSSNSSSATDSLRSTPTSTPIVTASVALERGVPSGAVVPAETSTASASVDAQLITFESAVSAVVDAATPPDVGETPLFSVGEAQIEFDKSSDLATEPTAQNETTTELLEAQRLRVHATASGPAADTATIKFEASPSVHVRDPAPVPTTSPVESSGAVCESADEVEALVSVNTAVPATVIESSQKEIGTVELLRDRTFIITQYGLNPLEALHQPSLHLHLEQQFPFQLAYSQVRDQRHEPVASDLECPPVPVEQAGFSEADGTKLNLALKYDFNQWLDFEETQSVTNLFAERPSPFEMAYCAAACGKGELDDAGLGEPCVASDSNIEPKSLKSSQSILWLSIHEVQNPPTQAALHEQQWPFELAYSLTSSTILEAISGSHTDTSDKSIEFAAVIDTVTPVESTEPDVQSSHYEEGDLPAANVEICSHTAEKSASVVEPHSDKSAEITRTSGPSSPSSTAYSSLSEDGEAHARTTKLNPNVPEFVPSGVSLESEVSHSLSFNVDAAEFHPEFNPDEMFPAQVHEPSTELIPSTEDFLIDDIYNPYATPSSTQPTLYPTYPFDPSAALYDPTLFAAPDGYPPFESPMFLPDGTPVSQVFQGAHIDDNTGLTSVNGSYDYYGVGESDLTYDSLAHVEDRHQQYQQSFRSFNSGSGRGYEGGRRSARGSVRSRSGTFHEGGQQHRQSSNGAVGSESPAERKTPSPTGARTSGPRRRDAGAASTAPAALTLADFIKVVPAKKRNGGVPRAGTVSATVDGAEKIASAATAAGPTEEPSVGEGSSKCDEHRKGASVKSTPKRGEATRCIYGSGCKNSKCQYFHPFEICKFYPNCKYEGTCLYIHKAVGAPASVQATHI